MFSAILLLVVWDLAEQGEFVSCCRPVSEAGDVDVTYQLVKRDKDHLDILFRPHLNLLSIYSKQLLWSTSKTAAKVIEPNPVAPFRILFCSQSAFTNVASYPLPSRPSTIASVASRAF